LLQGVLDQDGASAPVIVLRDVSGRCRIEKLGAGAATVTFDGQRRPVTRGPGSAGAAGALESLAFDCIEGLAGYLARGWSLSLLGERFAGSEAEMNQGPWYDVYRIMPPPGGDGTEVERPAKLWYFDSDTELLRMVRYSDPQFSGGDAITRLSDWRKQDGEYVAGKIERLRGGQMVLSFRMTGTQILTDTGDNPFDSAA
jgi:hypothetical protein